MDRAHFPERLDTRRLRLRRHESVRAAEMFGLIDADRARLSLHLPWVSWTRSAEDEREYVTAVNGQWDRHEFFDYAMFAGGEYLGNIGVHTINWHVGTAEIGYWILGPHEGKGFVTEACAALVELCFARGFHRLEIRCHPANRRSAGVPRRLGFRLEACLRESGVDQYGRHHDILVFARLRDDVADRVPAARPACLAHWAESDEGPQSYYPESVETFGEVAKLARTSAGFEVEHLVLAPGRRSWWPHAARARDTLVFVLEGRPELWLDGDRHALVAGDVVELERGSGRAHTFLNAGAGDARVLVVRSKADSNWWDEPPPRPLGAERAESDLAQARPDLA